MERPMRSIILASAAALALATVPAIAQNKTSNDPSDDTSPAAAAVTSQPAPPSADQAGAPEQPAPQSAEQANDQAASAPPTTTVIPPAASGAAATIVRTNPGNLTAPPASSLAKHYPLCTRRLQDNCQNPGEGGAPGRSRALGYWPGKPASEGGR